MHYALPRRNHCGIAVFLTAWSVCLGSLDLSAAEQITHSFLATGAETRIIGGDGKVQWRYPASTRDGCVLPNGNVLLAVSKNKEYPGGAVLELTRDSQKVFEFKGTQSEVNTAQLLANGNIMLTEAGDKPRVLEVTRAGKIVVSVPLMCQHTNHHMESRMSRKLPNGNYLVPQLYDKIVREYDPTGKIVQEINTPPVPTNSWPFTAIRLPNGNSLIDCTHGDLVIEVDPAGKIVWQLSNADLPDKLLNDPCGAQRLPNGNTVICSYAIGANRTKLVEVTREKKVVWTYTDEAKAGIHEVQILDTNGTPIEGPPLR
jgi:hypothetical protein